MNVLIKGLDSFEQNIVTTAFKLHSQHQAQLRLVPVEDVDTADVVIVDNKNQRATNWSSKNYRKLKDKTVIWVDGQTNNKQHAVLRRPVMWVNLPIIISRILDDISGKQSLEKIKLENKTQRVQNKPTVASTSGKKNILVVDDSAAIREYMSSILSQRGFATETAEDGEVALKMFADGTYDSVFMDVLMPGIDGYEACRQIKNTKKGKETPVFMLTGKGSMFDRIRGKMAGCDAYLTKPVDVTELLATLKEHA